MNKKTIFITGATGFIGKKLADSIIKEFPTAKIFCLVRDPNKLGELKDKVTPIQGDLSQDNLYKEMLLKANYVFHTAAIASLGNQGSYLETNIVGTRKILDILKESSELERFVFTSSTGAVDRHPDDSCNEPLTEECVPHPLTVYGKSKVASEKEIMNSGISWTIVRFPLVYGQGMRENSHLRVFVEDIKKDKPYTKINFPGRFSPIDVRDAVDFLMFVAQNPQAKNELFFICDPIPISYGEVFLKIRKILDRNTKLYNFPLFFTYMFKRFRKFLPLTLQSLFNDIWVCSDNKARNLGFQAKICFDDGLKDLIASLENKKEAIIITGAGSGIGKELALSLSTEFDKKKVFLLDVNEESIKSLSRENENFLPYAIDLANVLEIKKFLNFLEEEGFTVPLLINNAGIGVRGLMMSLPVEKSICLVDINIKAMMYLTHWVVNHMLTNNIAGKIVNISSSIAFSPLPLMSVYGASKTFVLYFTEALMQEYKNTKIDFYCVCPSGTATNFQKSSEVKTINDNKNLLSPSYVAQRIVDLIKNKKSKTIIIGRSGKVLRFVCYFLPRKIQLRLFYKLMNTFR